jgi:excinuclease UvrABC nuclease subunit
MVSQVADFDYIVTDSEAEALILESTLIKALRPEVQLRFQR